MRTSLYYSEHIGGHGVNTNRVQPNYAKGGTPEEHEAMRHLPKFYLIFPLLHFNI